VLLRGDVDEPETTAAVALGTLAHGEQGSEAGRVEEREPVEVHGDELPERLELLGGGHQITSAGNVEVAGDHETNATGVDGRRHHHRSLIVERHGAMVPSARGATWLRIEVGIEATSVGYGATWSRLSMTTGQNGGMVQRVTIAETADGMLALGGELDAYAADTVERALADLPSSGDADVDVSAVTFVDSAMLRVLVRQSERLATQGSRLRLVRPSPALRRLIELSGLESAFVLESGDPDGGQK